MGPRKALGLATLRALRASTRHPQRRTAASITPSSHPRQLPSSLAVATTTTQRNQPPSQQSRAASTAPRRPYEAEEAQRRALGSHLRRTWEIGDVYAPHDLSAMGQKLFAVRSPPKTDAFDALSLNPLDMYKNFAVMSEYITDMGRIRGRKETGLRPVNQRKMAKAVRRAIALGLCPSVHRHPEILKKAKESGFRRGAWA